MTMLSERVVVTAKEFLDKNINDSKELNEILNRTKWSTFNWNPQFSASSMVCEIIWKIAIGRETSRCWQQLHHLFSPSPIATHANFRGCLDYKTGNLPQKGAIAVWKLGNQWKGDMAIVTDVSNDNTSFDVIKGSLINGSEQIFFKVEERKGKSANSEFRSDKMNLIGFIYPPDREIA